MTADSDEAEVLAIGTQLQSMAWWLCPVFGANALVTGFGALSGRLEPVFWAVAIPMALTCGLYIYASTGGRLPRLVLLPDALELRRALFPTRRAWRKDVVAIRGEFPNHPEWSEGIVVETRERQVRFSLYDAPRRETIARLRRWADLDDRPEPDDAAPSLAYSAMESIPSVNTLGVHSSP